MRGGYRIVNFKKKALTSGEAAEIAGIYDQARNPHGKPTMVSGLVVNDVEYPEFYTIFTSGSNTVTAKAVVNATTLTIAITNEDNVTVTVASATDQTNNGGITNAGNTGL